MPKGFVYILECSDGSYYTGSTIDLELRLQQHLNGQGANHTKKRLPVELVYFEEFQRIDDAFYREKQIQGWNRAKKEALIKNLSENLPKLSISHRDMEASRTLQQTQHDTPNSKDSKSLVPEALEDTTLKTFRSNGKLLLTAEYVVLDGALALALPTKFGQSTTVEAIKAPKIIWKSYTNEGIVWFEDTFEILNSEIASSQASCNNVSKRLLDILNAAKKLNPEFLNSHSGFKVTNTLEFPQNWGLGSSSTLINNIANWAHIDAHQLLEMTFGGSGYDIACAQHDSALTYKLLKNNEISRDARNDKRDINIIKFNPSFKEHLYFIHLNKKQDSREGIAHYKSNSRPLSKEILEINDITQKIITCKTLSEFETLIEKHEEIISNIIQLDAIKKRLFKDFNGAIKSLGAWGGDFVLVASREYPGAYFKSKGYETILSYKDMILN